MASPHAARNNHVALILHGREGSHADPGPKVRQLWPASPRRERKKRLAMAQEAKMQSKLVDASDTGQHDRQTNDPITGERQGPSQKRTCKIQQEGRTKSRGSSRVHKFQVKQETPIAPVPREGVPAAEAASAPRAQSAQRGQRG